MHWSLKSFSAANDPSRCRQAISAKRRWQLKTKIYNYVLNRILTKLTALHEIHTTKKRRSKDRRLVLALSIFPGRCQPSIVDRNELNYRVRNGNGWTLILISTNSMSSSSRLKTTLLYCLSHLLSRLFVVTRTGFEPMLTAWEAAVLTTWPTGHGAPSRTRTGDPLIKSQLLYQLS